MRRMALAVLLLVVFVVGVLADDYDATSLDQELRAAGIPIDGCDSTGRVSFRPEATAAHRQKAEEVKAAHDKAKAVAERARPVRRYVETCALLRTARAERLAETDPEVQAILDRAVQRLEAEKATLRNALR